MRESSNTDLSVSMLLLMAIACGLCTGSNYYSQPLLNSIAQEFVVTNTAVAYISTLAQTLYTLGLFFLVPLGDMFNKKKIIVCFMALTAIGQFMCAFSLNLYWMYWGTALSSLFSIAAQVLIPFATLLVKPERSAQVVGTLMSGLLMGILLARTIAGFLSTLMNWHVVYVISGSLLALVSLLIFIQLPNVVPQKVVYRDILSSMFILLKTQPVLQKRSVLGGLSFATVSSIFTTMALVLSEQPYVFNDLQIGLVGLVGITGVLLGPWIGSIFQQGKEAYWTRISTYLLLLSWVILLGAQVHLLIYLLGLVICYVALSMIHILNQNVVYQINQHARSRLNSIYMTIYFSGAALGSFFAIYLWNVWGWIGCCIFGLIMSMVCILVNELWKISFQSSACISSG